jgi:hypothetical protein
MKKKLLTTLFTAIVFSIIIYPVIGYPIIGSIQHTGPGAHGHEDGNINELFIAFAVLVGVAIGIWFIRRHRKLSRRKTKQRKAKK